MIYPIVKYGNPVLEKPAEPVTVFDDELKKLVDDMFESMYEAHGVGLAAPQIGISKRLAVIDVTFKEDPDAKLVLANPEILHTEGKHTQPEGCLSIPEFREPVKAAYERSDVCVVPAAGVAAEAMVALTLARCALEKFGGDSMTETLRNYRGYFEQLRKY